MSPSIIGIRIYCDFFFSQLHLLEESWRELFILSLAQWEIPLEPATLLECAGKAGLQDPQEGGLKDSGLQDTTEGQQEGCSDGRKGGEEQGVHTTITQLREAVTRCRQLQLDRTEYTCLKAIVLFKPGECFIINIIIVVVVVVATVVFYYYSCKLAIIIIVFVVIPN